MNEEKFKKLTKLIEEATNLTEELASEFVRKHKVEGKITIEEADEYLRYAAIRMSLYNIQEEML